MNWFPRRSDYDPREKTMTLTARFIAVIVISVVMATLVTITVSICLNNINSIITIQAVAALFMLFGLGALIRGYHTFAAHIVLVAGFSSLWLVIFLDPSSSLLSRTDSIVLVIGLSSAMSIAFFKTRKPIVAYFILNIALFLVYNLVLAGQGIMDTGVQLEYFFDNSLALAFVFLVSYSAFGINQQALASLTDELAERKNVEKALLDNKHLLSDHLNRTPVGAIFWDMNFRVTEWNPEAEVIFGYSKAEALGKTAHELILPKTATVEISQVFEELLAEKGRKQLVSRNITKTGRTILCEWYNSVLKDSEGRAIGAASLVNDITEKTKIQEVLVQSEKMLSIGGLAAGMAHEINNPLAGMLQCAQMVSNRLTRDMDANARAAAEAGTSMAAIRVYTEKREIPRLLGNIEDAGQRALEIIENMLDFSRQSDLKRVPLDLGELIDNTLDLAGNDNNLKPISIVKEYGSDIPPVFGEKSKLQQVLFNLFKNASDAMKSRPDNTEPPRLTIRLKKGKGHVHLEVEDNGPGMDEAVRDQIFKPFFTTKKEEGTGLGLSISYFIVVDNHGGQISVDSAPGQGTRFTIKLPFRQAGERPEG